LPPTEPLPKVFLPGWSGWLSQDPTFRLIGSEKIWVRGAAVTSRLQSSETDLLERARYLSKGLFVKRLDKPFLIVLPTAPRFGGVIIALSAVRSSLFLLSSYLVGPSAF
jgi:hypothetical protein